MKSLQKLLYVDAIEPEVRYVIHGVGVKKSNKERETWLESSKIDWDNGIAERQECLTNLKTAQN